MRRRRPAAGAAGGNVAGDGRCPVSLKIALVEVVRGAAVPGRCEALGVLEAQRAAVGGAGYIVEVDAELPMNGVHTRVRQVSRAHSKHYVPDCLSQFAAPEPRAVGLRAGWLGAWTLTAQQCMAHAAALGPGQSATHLAVHSARGAGHVRVVVAAVARRRRRIIRPWCGHHNSSEGCQRRQHHLLLHGHLGAV